MFRRGGKKVKIKDDKIILEAKDVFNKPIISCCSMYWKQYVSNAWSILKSDNLQYNMVGRWVDGMTVLLSDGPMFILID